MTYRTFLVARRYSLCSNDAGRGGVVAEHDFGDASFLFALSAALRYEVHWVPATTDTELGLEEMDRSKRRRKMECVVENFSSPIFMSAQYFSVRFLRLLWTTMRACSQAAAENAW